MALLAREDVPEVVRKVLAIRRQVGKSSTAKYESVLNVASPKDGRARGLLQYHAAGTGRWGGRLFQPQNLPKGLAEGPQEAAIASIKDPGGIFPLEYGDEAMDTLSGAVRGCIVAGEGKELVVADYAQIEARVLFWLAGEERGLEMFRRGEDIYLDLAKFVYRNPGLTKKDSKERAVGKAGILGCGYGMGKDRFVGQCATWGINLSVDAANTAIRAYREKYKTVVALWKETENAAISAVKNPEKRFKCAGGRVTYGMDKKREFLCCALPSGRIIRYFRPSTKRIDTPYGEKDEIHYWAAGINGSLEEFKTYGGSLVENICQAVARDIMASGMVKAAAAGFDLLATVHDELVAEVLQGLKGSLEKLIALMCDVPKWGAGCPITAEGWVGRRYRK
jgi:DNA polymerase